MIECNYELGVGLSNDIMRIAQILVAKGIIPSSVDEEMQIQTHTSQYKAAILVGYVRNTVEIAPRRFHEFVNILLKRKSTEDVAQILNSHYKCKKWLKVIYSSTSCRQDLCVCCMIMMSRCKIQRI